MTSALPEKSYMILNVKLIRVLEWRSGRDRQSLSEGEAGFYPVFPKYVTM